jgi:dTDP-glucose pyrophosphorylase
MKPTLLILAAGMGSRYGGLKQLDPMGPHGETVLDYSVFDAIRAGFGKVVFVIRKSFAEDFKAHIGPRFEGRVEVDYCYQELDDLPEGFSLPEGREKPWGTAHAILAAAEVIQEPFAALNADDFYGRETFATMAKFLAEPRAYHGKQEYAMMGFRLNNTLSDHGTVARGICEVNGEGLLESVTEMTKIAKTPTGARNEEPGKEADLTGEELVSMNFWGFNPTVFPALRAMFIDFLKAEGAEMKSEFFIPKAVDQMIKEGQAVVRMLPTESEWFGVTYQEDRLQVVAAIQAMVDAGEYPADLSQAGA